MLYVATLDAMQGKMTVGEFTSFIAALMLITAPLRRLVNVAGPLQQGIAAAQSIFELLDAHTGAGGRRDGRSTGRAATSSTATCVPLSGGRGRGAARREFRVTAG